MSDGKNVGSQVGESAKGLAKATTVDLAKDVLEQILGGNDDNNDKTTSPNSDQNPQQKMLQQAQKNAKIAQIALNIRRIKKERELARRQVAQREEERQKKMEEHKQAAKKEREEGGFAKKSAGIFKNFSNFLARQGKGEQRGAKMVG